MPNFIKKMGLKGGTAPPLQQIGKNDRLSKDITYTDPDTRDKTS
jgi:hypothetical protein